MGIKAEDYPAFFRSVFTLTNIRGALVTMPHKVTTMELVDEVSPIAEIAGATNAVVLREDGSLLADQFDGAGFVRGVLRKGFDPSGKRALVVGNGGVGSPIAASLAGIGLAGIGLFDPNTAASEALAQRIDKHYPDVELAVGSKDPEGYDLIVNATPIGMRDGDPCLSTSTGSHPVPTSGTWCSKPTSRRSCRPPRTRAAPFRWAATCCSR